MKFKKIYIEITNKCNLNCSFCSKDKREKKTLTKEEFKHILDEVKDYTNYIYLHVKGEPLLHKDIIKLIKMTENYNLKVNLTTNGVFIKKYYKQLNNCSSLNKINFSLHSENNKINYLEDIFESVNLLSTKKTIIYRLWTLNNNKLDKKSTEIVEKLKEYYNLSTEIVEKIKIDNNIKINNNVYVDKDNKFVWPSIDSNNQSKGYCYGLKTQLAILSNGVVVPCCLDSEGIINLGNIFNNSLKDIISSEKFTNLKKSFQDRTPCEELCKKCTFKNKLIK